MYSMKEACEKTGLAYETLKFYCNQGLVPHVKRDKANHRVFSESDVSWLQNLTCLKNCGMSISEMRHYIDLCVAGEKTIPDRKHILAAKKEALLEQIELIQKSVNYIDWKQRFYDDILAGKMPYHSDLVADEKE